LPNNGRQKQAGSSSGSSAAVHKANCPQNAKCLAFSQILPQLIILMTAKQKAEQFGSVRNFGQKLSKAKKNLLHNVRFSF